MSTITKEAAVGQEFSGKPKRISWQRLWAFSGGPFAAEGWPKKNLHTDTQVAITCGLPSVAASATQFQGYMAELMVNLFGEEWFRRGEMTLKFIKPVPDDDVLTSKVRVQSKEEGSPTKITFEAWCENKNGEPVAVGTASGLIP